MSYVLSLHRMKSEETTVNTSTNHSDCREALRDLMGDALLRKDPEAMDELIARARRRARQTAEDLNTPSDARVILHVAHSFADELATTNPQFDRVGFVRAATHVGTR
jgi:hypothetical protein